MHWGMGSWMWPGMGWAWLWPVSLLVGAVFAGWLLSRPRQSAPRPESAEEILRERFARGEIDEKEYRARLATLER